MLLFGGNKEELEEATWGNNLFESNDLATDWNLDNEEAKQLFQSIGVKTSNNNNDTGSISVSTPLFSKASMSESLGLFTAEGRMRVRGEVARRIVKQVNLSELAVRAGQLHRGLEVASKLSVTTTVTGIEARPVLVPHNLITCQYSGNQYRLVMNGISGELRGTIPFLYPISFHTYLSISISPSR